MDPMQSLVQSLGISSATHQRVEDRHVLVPNVASMRAILAKGRTTSTGFEQPCTDANLQRQKMELAIAFAQRIDPKGIPEPYLEFTHALGAAILRGEGDDGAPGTATDTPGKGTTETPESAETAEATPSEGGEFGIQKLNVAAYPLAVQKTLNQVVQQIQRTTGEEPKTLAEIFNFSQYALTAAEKDLEAYAAQEQRANVRFEQLQARKDPKGIEKRNKTEKLLTAIRADKAKAETVCGKLSAVVQEMERLDGGRIKDGFNILPKAFKVLEERADKDGPQGISATELSNIYCESILKFDTPSQFYEDYVQNYSHISFCVFIALGISLLGDDIRSMVPSRGPAYLKGICDGLFHVKICNQVYNSLGKIAAKIFRFTRSRELESGTYVPNHLIIIVGEDGTLRMYVAHGEEEPVQLAEIRMGPDVDHFGKISELFMDNGIEDFVLSPAPDMDRKSVRQLKNSIVMRYGRPVHDSIPKFEIESLEVASPELNQ
jgi:hypothetical protein